MVFLLFVCKVGEVFIKYNNSIWFCVMDTTVELSLIYASQMNGRDAGREWDGG